MELVKIHPRGFCHGVVAAWQKVLDTLNKNKDKKIYMLGIFVHNHRMIDEIKTRNLIILDDSNISRYELVNSLDCKKGEILILSAHGTDRQVIDLAISKGLEVVDTTCEYVYKTHNIIKLGLEKNQTVIFLGVKNHPETVSILSISKKIIPVYSYQELTKLTNFFDQNVLVTNQTTFSIYDLEKHYKFIKEHFKNFELANDICNATQERQAALLNLTKKLDKLIVVGDKKSNNSKQLLKLGKLKRIKSSFLVNNISDLKKIKFKINDVVGITAGASTPTIVTNEIINYLQEYKWN